MPKTEDKGKTQTHDQSDLLGVKPFNGIGPGRSTQSIVKKLKSKKASSLRAEGSTQESGERANGVGGYKKLAGNFANRY